MSHSRGRKTASAWHDQPSEVRHYLDKSVAPFPLWAQAVVAPRNPMVGTFAGCCARAARGHAAAPPSATNNSRRPMVTVIRPSRSRLRTPARDAPIASFDHLVGNSEQLARPTVAFGTKRTGSIKLDRRVGLLRCMRPLRHLADMHSRARLRGSHPGSARPNLSRFGQCDCPAIPIGSIHPRCEVMRSRGCAVRESCTPASAGRVFFPHMRGDDVIYPRPALRRDVPKSPFTPTGSASAHRRASHFN